MKGRRLKKIGEMENISYVSSKLDPGRHGYEHKFKSPVGIYYDAGTGVVVLDRPGKPLIFKEGEGFLN